MQYLCSTLLASKQKSLTCGIADFKMQHLAQLDVFSVGVVRTKHSLVDTALNINHL